MAVDRAVRDEVIEGLRPQGNPPWELIDGPDRAWILERLSGDRVTYVEVHRAAAGDARWILGACRAAAPLAAPVESRDVDLEIRVGPGR